MNETVFSGFPAVTFRFLKGLSGNNTKLWFTANRDDYESGYLAPARALVDVLGPRLRAISPGVNYLAKVNGSIFRINRDVRFSKDKTPYKDHLDIWFWHGEKKSWGAPGFYLRLSADRLILGTGMHRFEKAHLEAYRQAVLDDRAGPELEKAVGEVLAAGPYELGQPSRRNVPRGFDKDHARAQYLRHDGLTIGLDGKIPAAARKGDFIDVCANHYAAMMPLTAWLIEHVSDGS
jgi:uncharacterized protein (TIGR02453 family)